MSAKLTLSDRPAATLLHTADCHIGSSPGAQAAFALITRLGLTEHFDAFVIAGDLFDDARVEQNLVDWVAEQLGSLPFPVVILPGNHDVLDSDSIYARFDRERRYPTVHVLSNPDGELIYLPTANITVWGRPTVHHSPEFRPLLGIPPRPVQSWAVVVGHGQVEASDEPTLGGSPIYPRDLESIDWDYVALGHIPRFLQVKTFSAPAYYAGSSVRGADDGPGGVAIVRFAEGAAASVCWRTLDDS